jgi:hypothetical protein
MFERSTKCEEGEVRCGAEQTSRESVEFAMVSVAGRVAGARFTRCACLFSLSCAELCCAVLVELPCRLLERSSKGRWKVRCGAVRCGLAAVGASASEGLF